MGIRWATGAVALATLITLSSGGAGALELGEQFELHGYGDLSYERSTVDAGDMHLGDREIAYNTSLVGIWRATDRIKVWTQLFRNSELGKTRVDWAFVDYQIGGAQTLRLGRIRLPFGLRNAIRDVQALRPTASMPYMYDEELTLVDESFDGASVEHSFRIGASTARVEAWGAKSLQSGGAETTDGAAIGVRLILETPIKGLSLRGAAYQGRLVRFEEDTQRRKRAWSVAAHYLLDDIDLEAEMAHGFLFDHSVSTWYLQAAVPLADRWKAAARIERINTDTRRRGDDAFQEQRLVLGLAYTIDETFGLRLEQQFHRGYGIPVIHEALEAGVGRHGWTSTVFSVNYQF